MKQHVIPALLFMGNDIHRTQNNICPVFLLHLTFYYKYIILARMYSLPTVCVRLRLNNNAHSHEIFCIPCSQQQRSNHEHITQTSRKHKIPSEDYTASLRCLSPSSDGCLQPSLFHCPLAWKEKVKWISRPRSNKELGTENELLW
jgi:hypothetical protein